MKRKLTRSTGFTLIAALLLLVLLSGVAIGLMMMVNTETRAGGNDLQNNLAYHNAEGAIEKMSSDLANMYRNIQSPQVADFNVISTLSPTDPGVNYPEYTATPHQKADGSLDIAWGQIKSGPNKDLFAQILQVDLRATAQRSSISQEQVSMLRTVEVALIPVFQFGVFSDSDLAFFTSPNLDFEGRVHTNGNLFLGAAGGFTVKFHDKVSAYGEVIRTVLPNGLAANCASCNDNGTVKILTSSGGCDGAAPACRTMATSEGSEVGNSLPSLTYNAGPPSWFTISTSTYNSWVINGNNGGTKGTGANNLSLPFVGGGAQPFEILRQPPQGEAAASPIGASREYNMAEIRILLEDDPARLPGGAADPDNVWLANGKNPSSGVDFSNGVPITGTPNTTYFAEASFGVPNTTGQNGTLSSLGSDWQYRPNPDALENVDPTITSKLANPAANIAVCNTGACTYPYYNLAAATTTSTWDLLNGYLRVEARDTNGNWFPVTREWLDLGFARGTTPPAAPGTNPVHPNAILLLQQLADRNWDGVADANGKAPACTKFSGGVCVQWNYATPPEVRKDPSTGNPYFSNGTSDVTRYNWYPINFYDGREGEPRDATQANNSCTAMGLMNSVEIDVGNLRQWLLNSPNGQKVDAKTYNGYIVYFSDRRGMLPSPNGTSVDPANTRTGDSGFEDVVNSGTGTVGTPPDNTLEPPNNASSPEDTNLNGKLDNFGPKNLGLGFFGTTGGVNNNANTDINKTAAPNPYVRMTSCTAAGKNWVSGARHVLKLVDGGWGNLPTPGFTVASENPVYIFGNYNTAAGDPTWGSPSTEASPDVHSAAGMVADAVTLLSNNWSDALSLTTAAKGSVNRPAATTWYRVAISAGKNRTFPALYTNQNFSFGTDGGLHNFLRFDEDWAGQTLNYKGSLVSLYYSNYATGTFKCCTYEVYQPPTRNYIFDQLFADYTKLPPGTPMFRDVEKMSYRQNLAARTN